jgi:uncharacterized membrane protein YkvA (DUF1232 family)
MKLTEKQQAEVRRLVDDISPDEELEVRATFRRAEKQAVERGVGEELLENVKSLWSMLTDPDFTVSWETKTWIIAGLAYFISPIDAIPDVIPVVGYLDDVVIVTWVMHEISEEVTKYRRWKGLS